MFLLKKILAGWLMPLPLCLTLLVIGLWFVWTSKRINLGRLLLTSGIILLLLFSNRFVSTWLIRPLERAFPSHPEFVVGEPLPVELSHCRFVVVLGGGHVDAPHWSALNRLSDASRGRLMEGVRILRVLPDAKLVLTGIGQGRGPSHAAVMADAAVSLGVEVSRIVLLETPRDTEEEAVELSKFLSTEPFALVTSAWHLRRATALMHNRGLNPVPSPCDYTSRPVGKRSWKDFLWDTESIGRSNWAVYERLGFLWAKGRGKI
ncbi:MAG TPA: ElyC/SanA/YdcF family protein [Opitutus sp.]|nr:ElyC/SanA/YdcF family protein [Opitutus sp.]